MSLISSITAPRDSGVRIALLPQLPSNPDVVHLALNPYRIALVCSIVVLF